jgi:hypothetical protein
VEFVGYCKNEVAIFIKKTKLKISAFKYFILINQPEVTPNCQFLFFFAFFVLYNVVSKNGIENKFFSCSVAR